MAKRKPTRECTVCGQTKDLTTSFVRNGLYWRHECRACYAARCRKYRADRTALINAAKQTALDDRPSGPAVLSYPAGELEAVAECLEGMKIILKRQKSIIDRVDRGERQPAAIMLRVPDLDRLLLLANHGLSILTGSSDDDA